MPRKQEQKDIAKLQFEQGYNILRQHPIFTSLLYHANINRQTSNQCPPKNWAVINNLGTIHVHPTRRGYPEEWVYVLAHCLLHLGFGHFQERTHFREWNAACNYFIAKFMADLKLGTAPEEYLFPLNFANRNEDSLYQEFCERGIPGNDLVDMFIETPKSHYWYAKVDWQAVFGEGLTKAVTNAVSVAAGQDISLAGESKNNTPAQKAKAWFINSYPLLGALATNFEIIEDPLICQRLEISVAAIDVENQQIFINPAGGLTNEEYRFVMAHELLHAGLRHDTRRQGREPYLWNVACDYVINSWLIEMGIGELPHVGALYDPDLKNLSAESIYDRIVKDLRLYRKLATLRGIGQCDILEPQISDWWTYGDGMALDEFYRRCLSQGLVYHQEQNRGFLPAGLIEEIRALSYPPIPWDVELAKWFDNYFSPLIKVRSYARLSRRQSATPNIPRPRYVPDSNHEEGRTFGVVLDTSGSMERELLGKALGAISSYSISHDVSFVRVVFCDAFAYDQGYITPESLADRVQVKGRGGTVLQPGIDLLERAEDFPKNGPLLIITDGYCDRVHIRREHAFLIPVGRHLPFIPKGQVLRIK
ncbi:vWA domain-containing protein [Nostoc sp. UHCC 0870]|uniref:vWA domain-containing protein n=1 Tax=Nostoc sp. UHCC 0870 TaxID=2914041 RepID=UPI001EE14CC9|nr:peptidase [Nostoc sp. UHCC 0870]UKP01247.1 peptidase [Nostoc sp. UHCC 0870]